MFNVSHTHYNHLVPFCAHHLQTRTPRPPPPTHTHTHTSLSTPPPQDQDPPSSPPHALRTWPVGWHQTQSIRTATRDWTPDVFGPVPRVPHRQRILSITCHIAYLQLTSHNCAGVNPCFIPRVGINIYFILYIYIFYITHIKVILQQVMTEITTRFPPPPHTHTPQVDSTQTGFGGLITGLFFF